MYVKKNKSNLICLVTNKFKFSMYNIYVLLNAVDYCLTPVCKETTYSSSYVRTKLIHIKHVTILNTFNKTFY